MTQSEVARDRQVYVFECRTAQHVPARISIHGLAARCRILFECCRVEPFLRSRIAQNRIVTRHERGPLARRGSRGARGCRDLDSGDQDYLDWRRPRVPVTPTRAADPVHLRVAGPLEPERA